MILKNIFMPVSLFPFSKNLIIKKYQVQENARLQFQTFSYSGHILSKIFTKEI